MKVVIGVDESFASRACFERVTAHNWPPGTEFTLVAVTKVDLLAASEDGREDLARHVAFELSATLHQRCNGQVVGVECPVGDPAKTIVGFASNWQSDLIVVGANAKTTMEKTFQGSVSQTVLDQAPCPVLIVRDSGLENRREFINVLVGVNASDFSHLALSWLSDQPWISQTRFQFVTVVPGLPKKFADADLSVEAAMSMLEDHNVAQEATKEIVAEVLTPYLPKIRNFSCSLDIVDGEPAPALVALALEQNTDLIVVGSHGRCGLTKLVLGSVSAYVAGHAPCSVLVAKPQVVPSTQDNHDDEMDLEWSRRRSAANDWMPHVPMFR